MPEYLISQHDPRGERAEQLAALRAAHRYDSAYGFPVAAGPPDGNGPSAHWQLRAIEEQERIRVNLQRCERQLDLRFHTVDVGQSTAHGLARAVAQQRSLADSGFASDDEYRTLAPAYAIKQAVEGLPFDSTASEGWRPRCGHDVTISP